MQTENLDLKELDLLIEKVANIVKTYMEQIDQDPVVADIERKKVTSLFHKEIPHKGIEAKSLLEDIEKNVIPFCTRIGHPRFLSWIITSPSPAGIIGEILNLAFSQVPFTYKAGPVATIMEDLVIQWFNTLFGYSKDSGGILVSGGTMGTLTALTVARETFVKGSMTTGIQKLSKPLVLYIAETGHHSVDKAAGVLGIGTDFLRKIPVDQKFRLRLDLLSQEVERDKKAGLLPFCVIGQVGTSITGAVDDVNGLADFCRAHKLWLHIDAAYGGGAILAAQGKELMKGIEKADSISMDPHKWFFIPVEAGCVLVKNREHLFNTFNNLPEPFDSDRDYDYMHYGIQSTRIARAFKIWFAFRCYGVEKISRVIEQNLILAQHFRKMLESSPHYKVSAPVTLSAVCFEAHLKDPDMNRHHQIQHMILDEIEKSGKAFLAPAKIEGKTVLRANFSNHRTTLQDLEILMELLEEIADSIHRK